MPPRPMYGAAVERKVSPATRLDPREGKVPTPSLIGETEVVEVQGGIWARPLSGEIEVQVDGDEGQVGGHGGQERGVRQAETREMVVSRGILARYDGFAAAVDQFAESG